MLLLLGNSHFFCTSVIVSMGLYLFLSFAPGYIYLALLPRTNLLLYSVSLPEYTLTVLLLSTLSDFIFCTLRLFSFVPVSGFGLCSSEISIFCTHNVYTLQISLVLFDLFGTSLLLLYFQITSSVLPTLPSSVRPAP